MEAVVLMLDFYHFVFAFYIIVWPACLNDMCQENGAYQPLTPVLLMSDGLAYFVWLTS